MVVEAEACATLAPRRLGAPPVSYTHLTLPTKAIGVSNAGMGGAGGNGTVIIRYSLGSTVTFHANNGTSDTSTQTASTSTSLTANTFSYGTCTFARWTTQQDGTGTPYTDTQAYDFSASIDLWAQWTCLQSAITAASVPCASYTSAPTLSSLTATIARKGTKSYISGVNPGAVYYWTRITMPNATSSAKIFDQNIAGGSSLRLTPMGSNLVYNASCVLVKGPKITVATNGSSASITNASGGATYIVAIKLGSGAIVGATVPPSWPVTWTFDTTIGSSDYDLRLSPKY